MIFIIWFVVWIFGLAATVAHLVVPAVCLVVRSSFLSRRSAPGWGAVFMTTFVFLLVVVSYPEGAWLYALRALLVLFLIAHVLSALRGGGIWYRGVQYDVAILMHLMSRTVRVARERTDQLKYSRRLRVLRERNRLKRYFRSMTGNVAYWRAAAIEMVELATRLNDMIQARGRFPHPSAWQDPRRIQSWLYVADVFLLGLALLGASGADRLLVPPSVLDTVQRAYAAAVSLVTERAL